jgi:hypothetical protein
MEQSGQLPCWRELDRFLEPVQSLCGATGNEEHCAKGRQHVGLTLGIDPASETQRCEPVRQGLFNRSAIAVHDSRRLMCH